MEDGFICVHLRHLRIVIIARHLHPPSRQARDIRGKPGGGTHAGPAGETPALRAQALCFAQALFM